MTYNVFIATSLDGYIATANGGIEWLESLPIIENEDYGYQQFVQKQDAILMGRHTFEKVLSFGFWPYDIPVFVLTQQTDIVPQALKGKANAVNQSLGEINQLFVDLGFSQIYIDGGRLISSFLDQNLISEMIITRMPITLGNGLPLFSGQKEHITQWRLVDSKSYSNGILQTHYIRG